MEKKELMNAMERADSTVEFFKLKGDILDALENTAYAKTLTAIKSVVDFYAKKDGIVKELAGKPKTATKSEGE